MSGLLHSPLETTRQTTAAFSCVQKPGLANTSTFKTTTRQERHMTYDLNLQGKVALVTGASQGLGKRFAVALAEQGVRVGLAARRLDKLKDTADLVARAGGQCAIVAMDVTDLASIRRGVDETENALGPIDILVNNAGTHSMKSALEVEEQDFDYIFDADVKGAYFVAQAVARKMVARGAGGRIINLGSVAGMKTIRNQSLYCMAKAAVLRMTQSLAAEWLQYDINVNAICPGYMVTDFSAAYMLSEKGEGLKNKMPRKRWGTPEDLDGMLLLLASGQSRFVNGAVITIDDGYAVM